MKVTALENFDCGLLQGVKGQVFSEEELAVLSDLGPLLTAKLIKCEPDAECSPEPVLEEKPKAKKKK